ncbi:MAG TPA: hypothetical protein VFZ26_01725 [Gemmatimonadales bacterium]
MRITPMLVLILVAACAGNREAETAQARVRDTVLTASDTLTPRDTLDRARRAIPDTSEGLDTTSRR